jgi:cyclic 2,3-diphosphoglycerate synthetase
VSGARAVAIIDGEHHAPVVRDALAELPYDFAAAHLVGGTEKIKGGEDYGVPLIDDLARALAEHEPEVVVDLSDEPVLGPRERFRVASRVLALGVPYVGADFRLDPPSLAPYERPSLGIVGTGKRIGKTAATTHVARVLAERHRLVIVAMGRGGPPEPRVAESPTTLEQLLEISRAGGHAASDYLEHATLSGAATVGCRRCGGGLAGAVSTSNVSEAARLATERSPDLVIFEGSGSSLPPIATDKRLLVTDARHEPDLLVGYLNAYRLLVSDLVLLTMAEEGARHDEIRKEIAALDPELPVVATVLRPRPSESVEGKRVAVFTTAKENAHELIASHLRDEHGAREVEVSGNLSRRDALAEDLERVRADVYATEIKAAAIDLVAEAAVARDLPCVFVINELRPLAGEADLDAELRALADAAVAEPAVP